MRLSEKIIEKYNNPTEENHPSDKELEYMYCLYTILELLCNRLPDLQIISQHAIKEQTSYSYTLWHRNNKNSIDSKFKNIQQLVRFIEKFEEENKDVKDSNSIK